MKLELLDHLRRIVGASQVLTAPEHDLQGWEQDWRKRTRGRALAVVRPGHTDEVAAVVTYLRWTWGPRASAVGPGDVDRARGG